MKRAFIATTAVALVAGALLYESGDDPQPDIPVGDDLRAIVENIPPVPAPAPVQNPAEPAAPEQTTPEIAVPEQNLPAQPPPTTRSVPAPSAPAVETSPYLTQVFSGICTYEGSKAAIPVEVLHTKDADGNDQSQLWFGQRGWTHIFQPQIPRGVGPQPGNIFRVPLYEQGISLAYDMNNRVGRATMSTALFNQYFNGAAEDRFYNDKWICRLGPTRKARFVPPSLVR